jgi:para-nitrobenzyl esterase
MVWIYGGGFQQGSAANPVFDGARLAARGVIVVAINYRVGIFGFMAHPDLTAESPQHASGNYACLTRLPGCSG